jgi:hypothetical protein
MTARIRGREAIEIRACPPFRIIGKRISLGCGMDPKVKGGTMRLRYVLPVVIVLGLGVASLAIASSRDGGHHGKQNGNTFTASLRSELETPLSLHTSGTGNLTLTINSNSTMSYTLTYSGLSSAAQVAHVHFGQPATTGGVSFFFCGGGGKPACPAGTTTAATVTGTVGAADILGPTAQGIAVGDFNGIVQEIRSGFTYANVHTVNFPGGEIRGQLNGGHDDDEDDD